MGWVVGPGGSGSWEGRAVRDDREGRAVRDDQEGRARGG